MAQRHLDGGGADLLAHALHPLGGHFDIDLVDIILELGAGAVARLGQVDGTRGVVTIEL